MKGFPRSQITTNGREWTRMKDAENAGQAGSAVNGAWRSVTSEVRPNHQSLITSHAVTVHRATGTPSCLFVSISG
jgi:hypothetical protein